MPLPLIHYLYGSGISKFLRQGGSTQSSWALVTGATDGIGRALCSELSARGFDIVLHGRNAEKLTRAQHELQERYPQCQYRVVVVDAAAFSIADIETITAAVSDIPLTILVNNVGGTGPLSSNFKHFEDTTPKEIQELVSLNLLFPLQLTRAILPQLQRQARPTLVLTCGSQSYVGQPYVAAYCSNKGAQHTWMRALSAEQAHVGSKVEVTEVIIGATYTQQFYTDKNFAPGLFMPTAGTMARAIIARVGLGHRSVYAYFWHNLQTFALYSLLPNTMADKIVADIIGPSVEKKELVAN